MSCMHCSPIRRVKRSERARENRTTQLVSLLGASELSVPRTRRRYRPFSSAGHGPAVLILGLALICMVVSACGGQASGEVGSTGEHSSFSKLAQHSAVRLPDSHVSRKRVGRQIKRSSGRAESRARPTPTEQEELEGLGPTGASNPKRARSVSNRTIHRVRHAHDQQTREVQLARG